MIKRKLSEAIIRKEEYQIWNSFIDILAMESEEDLSEIQRHAQRAFWYDSEVQNGGHVQYFENFKMTDYSNVINSLKIIGANEYAVILLKASEVYSGKKRDSAKSIFSFIKKYKENEFGVFDSDYYHISPDMHYYLSEYLKKNQNEFIEIE